MIAGLVLTDGGSRLARHLANPDDNESVAVLTPSTLATDLRGAFDELRLMSVGCRTRTPFVHAWASPRLVYSDLAWDRYWLEFEHEFGLLGQPYLEVEHLKLSHGGRIEPHRHRVYVRLDVSGRAVPMSYSGLRLQKLSRIAEFHNGEPFVPGVADRSVLRHLRNDGRHDVADAVERAGLGVQRPKPAPSSAERAAAKRTKDFATDEVWRRAHEAWSTTTTGADFRTALEKLELALALGDKAPVVVTPAGNPIPLRRAISNGAKLVGAEPIRKHDLEVRLSGLALEPWAAVGKQADFASGPAGHIRRDRKRRRELARPSTDERARQLALVRDAPPLAPAQAPLPLAQTTPLPDLTPRQLQQLRAMADTPGEIEALIKMEDDPKRRAAKRKAQGRAARAALETHRASRKLGSNLRPEISSGLCSIARTSFDVDVYKARLAGVDAELGVLLRWVDVRQDHRLLHLRSGVVVVTSPEAAVASAAAAEAIPIMLAHAAAQGWTAVTISSVDIEWRAEAARAAARAGLKVLDDDLRATVEDQHQASQSPPDSPDAEDAFSPPMF